MERELGISYPTVRSRVEALVRALGFGPRDGSDEAEDIAAQAGDLAAARQTILERLAKREITADEAATAIRNLGKA